MYRGFDLGYSDLKRADRYISEFKRLEAADQMPRLQIVRLPNDHTHGATPLFPTPTAYVAENDLALGRIVEAVSHSKYWPQTAIFVVEDDSQNGSTTSMRTGRWRWSSALTPNGARRIRRCIRRPACCGRWS
jgi:hypothetical protein